MINEDEASTSNQRTKRKGVDYHKSVPQKIIIGSGTNSESEGDYSQDRTEDEYFVALQKKPKKQGLRGIAAHRAAVAARSKGWTVKTQKKSMHEKKWIALFTGVTVFANAAVEVFREFKC